MITKQIKVLAIALLLLSGTSCLSVFDTQIFLEAAQKGNLETLKAMIDEAPEETKNKALALAETQYEKQLVFTDKDFKPVVKFLILQGADILKIKSDFTRRFFWSELSYYLKTEFLTHPIQCNEIVKKMPADTVTKMLAFTGLNYPWLAAATASI